MQLRRQQRRARVICLILTAARILAHANAQALLPPLSLRKDSDHPTQELRANSCFGALSDISIAWGSLNRSAQAPQGVALVSTDCASRTVIFFDQVLISWHTENIGALCRLRIQQDAATKVDVALSTPATVRLILSLSGFRQEHSFVHFCTTGLQILVTVTSFPETLYTQLHLPSKRCTACSHMCYMQLSSSTMTQTSAKPSGVCESQ